MKKSINAIVGRSDHNLSSALNSLPDLRVQFATNRNVEYSAVPDSDGKKSRKVLKRKPIASYMLERQFSSRYGKIDQYQVKFLFCRLIRFSYGLRYSRQHEMEIYEN